MAVQFPNLASTIAAIEGIRQGDERTAIYRDQIAQQNRALDLKDNRAKAKELADWTLRTGMAILSAPPAQRAALYAAARAEAESLGYDTSRLPAQYDAATEGFIKFNVDKARPLASFFKTQGAGAGGGGAPADSGWTNPGLAPARVSAAPQPAVPPTAVAATPQAPPAPQPQVAGAGPIPMAMPPSAPQIAPGATPTQMAGTPPPDDAGDGEYVEAGRVGTGRWIGLDPGDTIKIDRKGEPIDKAGMLFVRKADGRLMMFDPKARKTFTTVDAGNRYELIDNETGQPTGRTIDKGLSPADQPGSMGVGPAQPDAAIAALRGFQPPPGWGVATRGGRPLVSDGIVMLTRPDDNTAVAFVPLPQRGAPGQTARWDDVRDDKGRLVGQRRIDTNEYKPIDRNAGGSGRPLTQGHIDSLGGAGSAAQEFVGLRDTFDDSFGGLPFAGNLDNWIKRNVPDSIGGADPKGQADWWQRYQEQKNLVRNRLFGSALTATEKAEFDKANIDPGMKADKIRTNLARQADAAMRAAAKMARALEASGYNREAIEAAIGIPLDSLPSPTAKPAADTPKQPPGAPPANPGTAPTKGADKPTLKYNPATGRLE